jgi:uncharacterized protein YyaL (SSP411 family)
LKRSIFPHPDETLSEVSLLGGTQDTMDTKSERTADAGRHAYTNRLAGEKSPYLLQHAHNPVDWFPWGEDAFEKARRENKPIFLSIGYSTCHWCHVMERETFEKEKVGEFLREHFVSIKVDREERPDIDKIYMTFVQSTTGAGGWPMSVFLTPELKPFFGGTYFPPDDRYGRPGFLSLLQQIHQLWESRRDDILDSSNDMHQRLQQIMDVDDSTSGLALNDAVLRQAATVFKENYDPRHGGFGGAPKFPQPSQPLFLLRCAKRFGDTEAIRMVLHTCDRMAAGGINDQLGGGFARYSVDAEWLVPHFEKMLYDNAQLVQLYLDAYLIKSGTGGAEEIFEAERYAGVVNQILEYVRRDMTHPEGGFYSAEDADSEGHEGKFYCWTREELSALLTPEEFNVAVRYFGITENGNFVDHSHPTPLLKQNVLSVVDPDELASFPYRQISKVADPRGADFQLLSGAKKKMLAVREQRVRPHLDDKVLASWNGLMLGAFARAYGVLGNEYYCETAERNLKFLYEKLWDANSKTLYHRWRDGERDSVQLLEAYAFLLDGVVHLYEATLAPEHLEFAIALAEAMLEKFHDKANGGFWQSAADAKDLILRVKEAYDGAEPSGNSVAILALLKLGVITGRKEFRDAAEKSLRLFAARLQQAPHAVTYMLQALDFSLQEPKRAVLAGDTNADQTRNLLHALHSVYQPNKVILGNAGPVEEFARTLSGKDQPTVYLCSGNACQAPTGDAAALKDALQA